MTATRRLPHPRTAILATVLAALVAAAVLAVAHEVGTEDRIAITAGTDRHRVELSLDERRTGVIDAELAVHDTGGRPAELTSVTLSAVMPAMGHAMSELTATAAGPGRYKARGELFTMTGSWEVVIRLTGPDAPDELTVPVTVTR